MDNRLQTTARLTEHSEYSVSVTVKRCQSYYARYCAKKNRSTETKSSYHRNKAKANHPEIVALEPVSSFPEISPCFPELCCWLADISRHTGPITIPLARRALIPARPDTRCNKVHSHLRAVVE